VCVCVCVAVRLCACVCQLVRMFMRDSLCPHIPNSVLHFCANKCVCVRKCVCVCVCASAQNGAIYRIMGRQLFEKEGLYLHKQAMEREKKPIGRKTDRERTKERKERGGKNKKWVGLGAHSPCHSGGVNLVGRDLAPGPLKPNGNNTRRVNRWQGNRREREGEKERE